MKIKEKINDEPQLEGSIDEIIRGLKEIQNYYYKTYETIMVHIDSGYENYIVRLEGQREETREEKDTRLKVKRKNAESNRQKKEKQLRQLAKELNIKVEL